MDTIGALQESGADNDAIRCVECGQLFKAHISAATRYLACPYVPDAPTEAQEACGAQGEPQTRVEAYRWAWATPTHRYLVQGGRAPWPHRTR